MSHNEDYYDTFLYCFKNLHTLMYPKIRKYLNKERMQEIIDTGIYGGVYMIDDSIKFECDFNPMDFYLFSAEHNNPTTTTSCAKRLLEHLNKDELYAEYKKIEDKLDYAGKVKAVKDFDFDVDLDTCISCPHCSKPLKLSFIERIKKFKF